MKSDADNQVIGIFAKPPVPGRTKSRLADEIGAENAARLSAGMLQDLVAMAKDVEEAQTWIFHSPGSDKADFSQWLPQEMVYRVQQGEDLGERMANAFREMLVDFGAERAVIAGSDSIAVSPEIFKTALSALRERPVVLQPAKDGGYTLVGQSTYEPRMFQGCEYGTSSVYAETTDQLRRLGVSYTALQASFDVDEAEDLAELASFVRENPRPSVQQVLEEIAWQSRGVPEMAWHANDLEFQIS